MKVIYRENGIAPGIELEPEGMINLVTDAIRDAVKFNKEISFTIITKKEKNEIKK